jgi:hypothetical protein
MDPDGRSISNFESHGPAVVPIVVRNDGYHWGNPGMVRTTVLAKPLVESVCDAERPPGNEKVVGSTPTGEGVQEGRRVDVVGAAG